MSAKSAKTRRGKKMYQKNTPLQNLISLRSLRNLPAFEGEGFEAFEICCFSERSPKRIRFRCLRSLRKTKEAEKCTKRIHPGGLFDWLFWTCRILKIVDSAGSKGWNPNKYEFQKQQTFWQGKWSSPLWPFKGTFTTDPRVSAKSAKPSAQRDRTFTRPSKPAKSTVFRILTETNMNSKSFKTSTKNGIGPNQIHPKLKPTKPSENGAPILFRMLLPDYTGKAFDFPRLFLVYRSQSLFCTLPVQTPY